MSIGQLQEKISPDARKQYVDRLSDGGRIEFVTRELI